MELAEAVGNVFKRERAILEIDAAVKSWLCERAVRLNLEGGCTAGGEVGIEGFSEFEVDGAAGGKVELTRAAERESALRVQVCVFPSDVQGVQADSFVGECGVDATQALEMNAGDGGFELLEASFAAKLLGVGERAFQGDRTGEGRFAAKGFDVRKLEE
jgi:hypothetical protein